MTPLRVFPQAKASQRWADAFGISRYSSRPDLAGRVVAS